MTPNGQKRNYSLVTTAGFIWGTFFSWSHSQFANGFGLKLGGTVVNFPAFCDRALGMDILQTNYLISIIMYNAGDCTIKT